MRDSMDGYTYCYHPDFTKIDPDSYEGNATGKDLTKVNVTGLHDTSVLGLGINKSGTVSIASEATSANDLNPGLVKMLTRTTGASVFEYKPYSWFGAGPTGCKKNCGSLVCSGGKCVNCQTDAQCVGFCVDGKCVKCKEDSHCNPGSKCVNNQCSFNGNCSIGYAGKDCEFKCDDVMPRCAKCNGTTLENLVCTETVDDTLFDLKSCTRGPTGTYGCQINHSPENWAKHTGVYCFGVGGDCKGQIKTLTMRDSENAVISYNYCYQPDFIQIDELSGINTIGLAERSVAGVGLTVNKDSTVSIASDNAAGPALIAAAQNTCRKTAMGSNDTINWFGVKYRGKDPYVEQTNYNVIKGVIIGVTVAAGIAVGYIWRDDKKIAGGVIGALFYIVVCLGASFSTDKALWGLLAIPIALLIGGIGIGLKKLFKSFEKEESPSERRMREKAYDEEWEEKWQELDNEDTKGYEMNQEEWIEHKKKELIEMTKRKNATEKLKHDIIKVRKDYNLTDNPKEDAAQDMKDQVLEIQSKIGHEEKHEMNDEENRSSIEHEEKPEMSLDEWLKVTGDKLKEGEKTRREMIEARAREEKAAKFMEEQTKLASEKKNLEAERNKEADRVSEDKRRIDKINADLIGEHEKQMKNLNLGVGPLADSMVQEPTKAEVVEIAHDADAYIVNADEAAREVAELDAKIVLSDQFLEKSSKFKRARAKSRGRK